MLQNDDDLKLVKKQLRWLIGGGIAFVVAGGLIALLVAIHLIHDYHTFASIENKIKELRK